MWSLRPASLDTNVAIYAFTGNGEKARAAQVALSRTDFISVQLLNEFANATLRKQRRPWPEVRIALGRLRSAIPKVLAIDDDAHTGGLKIAEDHQLSIYDSLILAVALSGGARTFYSEDMQHGMMIYERLRIVNPFLPGAFDE